MYHLPADANRRQQCDYEAWVEFLKDSKGKILEYNEDYYKYLRGVAIIRDLENYERAYMDAYDYVVMEVK